MLYVPTTNVQGFIYYFGIFYLKIGKFYLFFQLGKGQVMGPKISIGKSLACLDQDDFKPLFTFFKYFMPFLKAAILKMSHTGKKPISHSIRMLVN